MFRSTLTLVSSTVTYSTEAEFAAAVRALIDEQQFDIKLTEAITNNKILSRVRTLTQPDTLVVVTEWDVEASYSEFYLISETAFAYLASNGITSNFVTETV